VRNSFDRVFVAPGVGILDELFDEEEGSLFPAALFRGAALAAAAGGASSGNKSRKVTLGRGVARISCACRDAPAHGRLGRIRRLNHAALFHHDHAVAVAAARPRSCVIRIVTCPFVRQLRDESITTFCVVTSRPVVGSSQSTAAAGKPVPAQSRRAGTCARQFERIGVVAFARRAMRTASSISMALSGAPSNGLRMLGSTSSICTPTLRIGIERRAGSGRPLHLAPAQVAHLFVARAAHVDAENITEPSRYARRGQECASRRTRLPTCPSRILRRLPASRLATAMSTCCTPSRCAARRELDREVPDVEQRHARRIAQSRITRIHHVRRCGSTMSRKPSPAG